MRRMFRPALLPAAMALACALPAAADADGSRTFDVTVPLPCNIDPRPAIEPRQPLPLSLRLKGTTDAYAPVGSTVSFSNLQTSVVFPPEAKAAIGRFGADTIGGAFDGISLLGSADPFFGPIITPNENKLVTVPTTTLSATSSTEIPLTGPNMNSTVGPLGTGDSNTVSVFYANGSMVLSSSADPSGADVPISSSRAYDLICFNNDYTTVVATYPTAPPVATQPVISDVIGHALPRIGGVVVVRGTRLAKTTSVTVGGKPAAFKQVSGSQLVVVAPPLPRGSYPVVVTTPNGASAPSAVATLRYG